MYMPGRDTMHLRNNQAAGLFLFLHLATGTFLCSQAPPDRPQSQPNQRSSQPTALPADVDPADPALPVWARPPAAATASPNTADKSPGGVPAGQQSPPQGRLGEVTKSGGTYVYRQQVDEVILQAT